MSVSVCRVSSAEHSFPAGSSPRDFEFTWKTPALHFKTEGGDDGGDGALSLGRSLAFSVGSLGSIGGSLGPLGSEPLPMPSAHVELNANDVFSLPTISGMPLWLDQLSSAGITRAKSLEAYANDEGENGGEGGVVLPVGVARSPAPVGSLPPLTSLASSVVVPPLRLPMRKAARKRARSADGSEVELPVGAGGAPPAGAPPDDAPRHAKAQRRTLRGAFAGATQTRTVRMLPPPRTFFSTETKLDVKTYENLLTRVKKLVHGPPNKKLGKYYGARDWCCERCRNIFKDHTKPFKRPQEDVRSVLRKLRLQACVDVGMRGYASDASGNSINHSSKTTPLASEHLCAAGVRTMQLLQMVAPAPSAAAAAPCQQ